MDTVDTAADIVSGHQNQTDPSQPSQPSQQTQYQPVQHTQPIQPTQPVSSSNHSSLESHPKYALPPREEWGPAFWYVMKVVALGLGELLSEELKTKVQEFYESLTSLLPCPECRSHYAQLIHHELPLTQALESGPSVFQWVLDIENAVKERIKHLKSNGTQRASHSTPQSSSNISMTANPSHHTRPIPSAIRSVISKPKPIAKKSVTMKVSRVKPNIQRMQQSTRKLKIGGLPTISSSARASKQNTQARLEQSARNYKRPCSC